ncbi:hypothetical protein [Haliscomenobacter hydrossis]|uniref:Transposase (putative) YhgA-like domain-containing protein n=1 Tax=Haliscomenobacter hydrossis (strain ATCC 27775 / DSM 1100 / LMG 10767 / O) TaxID=760192 RepID=F4KV16_HALH1|nr:hypothetical protein [Haliscomenobacter hydrossis]AEE49182.1 hypothetical protein Halhy_1287 [Haliscomenobacter hydrossis DSM 1100]
MHISKDALWKGVIESLAEDFIRYFFAPFVHLIDFEKGFEFLDTELQKLIPDNPGGRRHADKLIKVWLKSGQEIWFLIHVEIQGYQDPLFNRRMFECFYRLWEKYQVPITGLAVYTDWDRTYHFSSFSQEYMGSTFSYQFNSYVLRDHLPAELAQERNSFAAIMEAAWHHLDLPEDEQDLRVLKLDLIQRLKQRNIPDEKISLIIEFIKYIAPFTNSEIQANFDQDLINLTNANIPMGLREAILEDVKKQGLQEGLEKGLEQGLEQGREEGREEGLVQGIEMGEAQLLEHSVPLLAQKGLGIDAIAEIYQISVGRVIEILEKHEFQSSSEEE